MGDLIRIMLASLVAAMTLAAQVPVFRGFDGRSGLPQSQVRALLEDRLGFLWVGTHGGVARMGASGFQPFGLAQGMGVGRVWGFLEDADGGIWVAQEDSNLALIRGSRVRVFGPAEGLLESKAHALALDPQGRVLVGTRRGLWRLERDRFSPVPLEGTWGEASLERLMVDRSGALWMGTADGRLGRLGPGGRVEDTALPAPSTGQPILGLGQSPAGEVYAATRAALFRRRGDGTWLREELKGAPPEAQILGFQADGRGNLLVFLGYDGLWIREGSGQVRLWTSRDGLPQEGVASALLDRRGILWVGTDGRGLQALALPGLSGLHQMGSEPLGAVLTLLRGAGGTTWAGSTRGLFRIEEGRGVTGRWDARSGIPGKDVRTLASDGRGGLWLGSNRGLTRWRDGRAVGPVLLPGLAVNQLAPWGDRLLVATGEGLAVREPDGRIHRHHLPPEYGRDLVYGVLADAGEVLVATTRGLARFRGNELEPLHRDAPFAQLRVIAMARDAQGTLWVGTVRGLFRQEGTGWRTYGVEQGLPDSHIYFLQPLPGGRLAVGHGQGVTLLDPAGPSVNLNQNLGLYSDETNRGCVLLDEKDRLWFGMVEGFCRLELDRAIRVPPTSPPIVLEARWEGGEAFQPTDLRLPGGVASLQLEFQVGQPLSFQPPAFEVQMEGLSAVWQPVGRDHLMRFGALSGGTYRFRVRASQDGVTWVEGPPLEIRVASRWHETFLGRLALLGLLLGAVALGVRWRTRRLRKEAEGLERMVAERTGALLQRNLDLERAHAQVQASMEAKAAFARMVAHDLRSPLTTLLLVAEELAEDLREDRKRASRAGLLAQESHRIEAMLQRLLDQAKADSFIQSTYRKRLSPRQVLEGLPDVLTVKAQGRKLAFAFEEAEACGRAQVEVDPLGIQQVVLNLVGNALKFTGAGGRAGLRSHVEGARWVMEVWDTGRGMTGEQVAQMFQPFHQLETRDAAQGWGLGLSITKALVEAHGGTLSVTSEPGAGSVFRVEIPLAG